MRSAVRILCLGNDLLADDSLGIIVANRLRQLSLAGVDIVQTSTTGFSLMDYLLNASRLLVVDTVLTGRAEPGTIHVVAEEDIKSVSGGSPHYVGLFETLALAERLLLPVPKEVLILAVEAADCTTVGGPMSPAVEAVIPAVADLAQEMARAVGYADSPSRAELSLAADQAIRVVVERFPSARIIHGAGAPHGAHGPSRGETSLPGA